MLSSFTISDQMAKIEDLDSTISDEVVISNLNLLYDHKTGQKYCVEKGYKLSVDERYGQFFRRYWTSDGWMVTHDAIELTLRKVELAAKEATNIYYLLLNSKDVPRLTLLIHKVGTKVIKAVGNVIMLGHEYITLDKDPVAGDKIKRMAIMYLQSFKSEEMKKFFFDEETAHKNSVSKYFSENIYAVLNRGMDS